MSELAHSNAIRQFSLLYVAEEDRLFLEVELEQGLRAFWITRRVALNLIGFLRERLSGEALSSDLAEKEQGIRHQALSAFERDIAESRNPLKSGALKQDIKHLAKGEHKAGLLKTVRLEADGGSDQRYLFEMHDTDGKGLGFKLGRLTLRNLENLFLKQMTKAQWS